MNTAPTRTEIKNLPNPHTPDKLIADLVAGEAEQADAAYAEFVTANDLVDDLTVEIGDVHRDHATDLDTRTARLTELQAKLALADGDAIDAAKNANRAIGALKTAEKSALASKEAAKRARKLIDDDRRSRVAQIEKTITELRDLYSDLREIDRQIETVVLAQAARHGDTLRRADDNFDPHTRLGPMLWELASLARPMPAVVYQSIARRSVGDPVDAKFDHWDFTPDALSELDNSEVERRLDQRGRKRWQSTDAPAEEEKPKRARRGAKTPETV